jgi:hypothetical protein
MAVDEDPSEEALCLARKAGRVDLLCELPISHVAEGDWHMATYTDHQKITYLGARHIVHVTETVSWEPRSPVKEALERMKGELRGNDQR